MTARTLVGFVDEYVHTKKPVRAPDDMRELTVDLTALWRDLQIRVKAGYRTDGASIPRWAWRVIGHPWAQYLPAAIVHDILYETEFLPRELADQCFRDLMVWLEVPAWRRGAMYRAVRLVGGFTWRKHTARSREYALTFLEVSG